VDGKKVAGMLIETKHIDASLEYVILGIGININQMNFTGLPNATSLTLITNKVFEIDEIFTSFLKECRAFETL
jgi:BirA family biotin operon repressor/biotin-[acetyl-CoA-carboxylase] ligase